MALTLLLGLARRDSAASTATDRLFQSVLQPAATPAPTATRRVPLRGTPTATVRPLAPELVAAKRLLPLVIKAWPPTPTPTPTPATYGFKGASDPWQSEQPKSGFAGLNIAWWMDWTFFGALGPGASYPPSARGPWANYGDTGPYPGLNHLYAPVLWCPPSANAAYDALVQAEARKHPGRVWLLFNEPDLHWGQCGKELATYLKQDLQRDIPEYTVGKAQETALRYIHYWEVIKAADSTAKVFCCGNYFAPMPTLGDVFVTSGPTPGQQSQDTRRNVPPRPAQITTNPVAYTPSNGRVFWETFIQNVALASHPLDGLHIHIYPGEQGTMHPGCPAAYPQWYGGARTYVHYFAEWRCGQEALDAAYPWFQAQPALASRPIWITETGTLDDGYGGAYLSQDYVLAHNMDPMQQWLAQNTAANQPRRWINVVAWYTSYDDKMLATNLLTANFNQLSTLGNDWTNWFCPGCDQ